MKFACITATDEAERSAAIEHRFGKDRITRMWGLQGRQWFVGLLTVRKVQNDYRPGPRVATTKEEWKTRP